MLESTMQSMAIEILGKPEYELDEGERKFLEVAAYWRHKGGSPILLDAIPRVEKPHPPECLE